MRELKLRIPPLLEWWDVDVDEFDILSSCFDSPSISVADDSAGQALQQAEGSRSREKEIISGGAPEPRQASDPTTQSPEPADTGSENARGMNEASQQPATHPRYRGTLAVLQM